MPKPEQGQPGLIWGENRDTRLETYGVRSMGDERFGKLIRALGQAVDDLIVAKIPDLGSFPTRSAVPDAVERERILESQRKARQKHVKLQNQHAQQLREIINFANMDPRAPAMYAKEAVFENDTPVLYFEYWGTEDLDEPDRDSVEFQALVGLNGYMDRSEGPVLVRSVIEQIYDTYTGWGPARMSAHSVPGELATLGTIEPVVFEPIVARNS